LLKEFVEELADWNEYVGFDRRSHIHSPYPKGKLSIDRQLNEFDRGTVSICVAVGREHPSLGGNWNGRSSSLGLDNTLVIALGYLRAYRIVDSICCVAITGKSGAIASI